MKQIDTDNLNLSNNYQRSCQKQYKILLFLLTIAIFIYWFIQGYFTVFGTDSMKEMINNVILLKFPETLWGETAKNLYSDPNSYTEKWHTARWTADIMPYIAMQTIGKFYAFITKDPVTSIYIAQGFYTAVYFTALAWIISLYVKIALKISLYSYHFLFLLFCCGVLSLISDFPAHWKIFSWLNFVRYQFYNNTLSLDTHYIWTTVLMLITLLPYWQAFFNNNRWNEKYSTPLYQTIWCIFILLTAFSSTGITFMFFVIQVMIGFLILFFSPQKHFLDKIKYLLFSPPFYVQTLYFGGISCVIAFLSEIFFGVSVNTRKFLLLFDFNEIIITLIKYSIPLILGLFILRFLLQKDFINKIKHVVFSPPSYVKVLYFVGVSYVIVFLFEKFFSLNIHIYGIPLSKLYEKIINLIKILVKYSIPFILSYLYYAFFYYFKKESFNKDNLSKFFQIALFSHIFVIIYFVFLATVRLNYYYYYINPPLIIIYLNGLIVLFHFCSKIKSPMLCSFLFIFIFSRYLYFIPHYPNNVTYLNEYKYYQDLHKRSNSRTNNQISTDLPPLLGNDLLSVLQLFTRHTGIIDYNVELIYQDPATNQ